MSRTLYKQKIIKQRIYGLLMLAICILIIIRAAHGTTSEECDNTAVLLFFPIGMSLLLSKTIMIS